MEPLTSSAASLTSMIDEQGNDPLPFAEIGVQGSGFHPKYSDPSADLILQSQDGQRFSVKKYFLQAAR